MRLFVAIDLPEEVKQEIGFRARELQMLGADVVWTPVGNMHLTLQFLGEVEAGRVPEIDRALKELAAKTKPFLVRLESLGAFPNADDPQVLWAGVGDGESSLYDLTVSVNMAMYALGYQPEKHVFKPHVTFGRSRSRRNEGALTEALLQKKYHSRHLFTVQELVLFESQAAKDGVAYMRSGVYPLISPGV